MLALVLVEQLPSRIRRTAIVSHKRDMVPRVLPTPPPVVHAHPIRKRPMASRVCVEDGRADLALDVLSEVLHSSRTRDGGWADGWPAGDLQRLETARISLLGRVGRWQESLERLDSLRQYYGEDLDER